MKSKKWLFDLYCKNLSETTNLKGGRFICPLCFNGFAWENVNLLTIEHIIPEALEGKIYTLTCKRCNNFYGSKYISKLIETLKVKDRLLGDLEDPIDAKMAIGENVITAQYFIKERRIILQPKRSNPYAYQDMLDRFRKGPIPNFNLNFKLGFKPEFQNIAILLMCYLMLFRYFGYSYVFSPWGLKVREIIVNQKLDAPLSKLLSSNNEVVLGGKTGLFLCKEPKIFYGYVGIQLNLITEHSQHTFIKLLPFLPTAKFDNRVKKTKKVDFVCQSIAYSSDYLRGPGLFGKLIFTPSQQSKKEGTR